MLLYKALGLYLAIAIIAFVMSIIGNVLGLGSVQFLFVFIVGLISLTLNCVVLFHLDSKALLTVNTERKNDG